MVAALIILMSNFMLSKAMFTQSAAKAMFSEAGIITGEVTVQDKPAAPLGNAAIAPSARAAIKIAVTVAGECAGELKWHIHYETGGHYDPGLACGPASGNALCISRGSYTSASSDNYSYPYTTTTISHGATYSWGRNGVIRNGRNYSLVDEPLPTGQQWVGGCVEGSSALTTPHDGYDCQPDNALTCEVGDLSGKFGKVQGDANGRIEAVFDDDYMVPASLLVSSNTVIAFHCASTVFTATLDTVAVDTSLDPTESALCSTEGNTDDSLEKVNVCAVANLPAGNENWAALAQCGTDEGVCENTTAFFGLSGCDRPLSSFGITSTVSQPVGLLYAYICDSFIATLTADDANTGTDGVSGTVVVSPAGINIDLDFSATDWTRLSSEAGCYANGIQYHIHTLWNPSGNPGATSLFGTEDSSGPPICGPRVTSLHYDPTLACSPESSSTYCATFKNMQGKDYGWLLYPDEKVIDIDSASGYTWNNGTGAHEVREPCVEGSTAAVSAAGTYTCNPSNWSANPFACEVGDISGKHGLLTGDFSGRVRKFIADPWLPKARTFKDILSTSSITFHCGEIGPRFLCAELAAPPKKTTSPPTLNPTAPPTPRPEPDDSGSTNKVVAAVFGSIAVIAVLGFGALFLKTRFSRDDGDYSAAPAKDGEATHRRPLPTPPAHEQL